MKIAIILAAGGSTRLGQPKQLVPWIGRTLLQHSIEQVTESGADRVVVVLGACHQQISESLMKAGQNQAEIVINDGWRHGQSSSLATGIAHVAGSLQPTDAVLVTVCDAPLISIDHYKRLFEAVTKKNVLAAATRFPDGPGVPSCFSPESIRNLTELRGDVGARRWLRAQAADLIEMISCPDAARDVDTTDDLKCLPSSDGGKSNQL